MAFLSLDAYAYSSFFFIRTRIFQPVHKHQSMAMPTIKMYTTDIEPKKVYILPVCISNATLRSDIGNEDIHWGMGAKSVPAD